MPEFRAPRAPETLRRRSLLRSSNSGRDEGALVRANETIANLIKNGSEHATGLRRNIKQSIVSANLDAAAVADGISQLGWRKNYLVTGVNATAGLGKSHAFLRIALEYCIKHPTIRIAIMSPTHALSEQSFRLFCQIASEQKVDATQFARTFVAVDEGCKRSCAREGNKKYELQRKYMAKCGVTARRFCFPEGKDDFGKPIHPGCAIREQGNCDYWNQQEGQENIRVWFLSHAAAKNGSLAAAGIKTRFDWRIVDEDATNLFVESEEIDLAKIPVLSSQSCLNNVGDHFAPEDHSELAAQVGQAILGFAVSTKDGSDPTGEICDGKFDIMSEDELDAALKTFENLRQNTLRPQKAAFAFNKNSEDVKDLTPQGRSTLQRLSQQRAEAEHCIRACQLLLSFHKTDQQFGYTVTTHKKNETTTIETFKRAGFLDKGEVLSGEEFNASEYEDAWQDYQDKIRWWKIRNKIISDVRRGITPYDELSEPERQMFATFLWQEEDDDGQPALRWSNPIPTRPSYAFLGSPVTYTDATLTPHVFEATFLLEPDAKAYRAYNFEYVLVPSLDDLVTVKQVLGHKFSRDSVGISSKNKRAKDEDTNRYPAERTAEEGQNFQRNAILDKVNTLLEYRRLKGEDPVIIGPKQLAPAHAASNAYFHTLKHLDYTNSDGENMPGILTLGSVAGANGYEDTGCLILLSQGFNESPRYYENLAIALTGKPVKRIGIRFENCDLEEYAINDKTGRVIQSSRPVHPDPLVEDLRWQHMEGQVIQAMARARGVRRGRFIETAEGEQIMQSQRPLEIILLNRIMIDEPYVQWEELEDVLPDIVQFAAAKGVWIDKLSQQGARQLANMLVPENLQMQERTWERAREGDEAAKLRNIDRPKGWRNAIVVLKGDQSRTMRVRVAINPAQYNSLKEMGLEVEIPAEFAIAEVLEGLEATGAKRALLKDIADLMAAIIGGEPLSSKTIRKAIEGLKQEDRYAISKTEKGLAVTFARPSTEPEDAEE